MASQSSSSPSRPVLATLSVAVNVFAVIAFVIGTVGLAQSGRDPFAPMVAGMILLAGAVLALLGLGLGVAARVSRRATLLLGLPALAFALEIAWLMLMPTPHVEVNEFERFVGKPVDTLPAEMRRALISRTWDGSRNERIDTFRGASVTSNEDGVIVSVRANDE